MKYSIRYYKGCPILEEVDEIIIKYNEKDPEIIKFVQKWKEDQRIILDISDLSNEEIVDNLSLFTTCNTLHNIAFLLFKDQDYVSLAEANLDFFFFDTIDCLDELIFQTNLGVSDIYIEGELGFYLKTIYDVYGDSFNIRVIPNTSESFSNSYDEKFKNFFIRPEDMEIYSEYVDIIEFAGSLTIQPVLYKIYKEGHWNGDLSILIQGLRKHINNLYIIPLFGTTRLNCKKRCAFDKCHVCDRIQDTAKILQEENLMFTTKGEEIYEPAVDDKIMSYEPAKTLKDDE